MILANHFSDVVPRIVPVLTFDGKGRLIKTRKFAGPRYVGDPLNSIRILNTKEVDELVILDITASAEKRPPQFAFIENLAGEAFMPLAYGGGLFELDDVSRIFDCGVEKVVISSALSERFDLIEQVSQRYGSQAVVVCLPIKKDLFGRYSVRTHSNTYRLRATPLEIARQSVDRGAGEVILYSIDRDGTWAGYDLDLLQLISSQIDIPVVACGGAGQFSDFSTGLASGASAVAGSSIFMFQKKDGGVLITYPSSHHMINQLND